MQILRPNQTPTRTATATAGGTRGPLLCLILGVGLVIAGVDPGRTSDAASNADPGRTVNESTPDPHASPSPATDDSPIGIDDIVYGEPAPDCADASRGTFSFYRLELPEGCLPKMASGETPIEIETGAPGAGASPVVRIASVGGSKEPAAMSETLEQLRIDIEVCGRRGEEDGPKPSL